MFSQQGRTTYNKWLNYDYNIRGQDTNDFVQVGSEVIIDLARPLTMSAPDNYQQFCKEQGLPVVGDRLNLANFRDYENLMTEIREKLYRNLHHADNYMRFTL